MAIRRGSGGPQEPQGRATSDLGEIDLVDELVKKSIAVNPILRRGRDTLEVMQGLRDEVLARAKTGPTPPLPETPGRVDPRLQTIEIYMRDKARTFPEATDLVHRQIAELSARLASLRDEAIRDIAELIGALLQTGLDAKACRLTLAQFRDLLLLLNISDAELIARAQASKRG